jgi:hypothetical protein
MRDVPNPNVGAAASVSPETPAALINLRRVISMSHWYETRVSDGSAKCEASTQMAALSRDAATEFDFKALL